MGGPENPEVMEQTRRILLIDDDYDHLLTCSFILKRRGYEVLALAGCENMDELTAAVTTFRPGLIFLEHNMRGICGMDLTGMLKSHTEFKKIPVIYFSGLGDIIQLATQAGADGYLKKPFEVDGLISIASKYFEGAAGIR